MEAHHEACSEAWMLLSEQNARLQQEGTLNWGSFVDRQKKMLAQLGTSLAQIRANRTSWLSLSADAKMEHPDMLSLLARTQELGLRILALHRENEQLMLRNGLVPVSHVSSIGSKSARHAAGVYQRQAGVRVALNAD